VDTFGTAALISRFHRQFFGRYAETVFRTLLHGGNGTVLISGRGKCQSLPFRFNDYRLFTADHRLSVGHLQVGIFFEEIGSVCLAYFLFRIVLIFACIPCNRTQFGCRLSGNFYIFTLYGTLPLILSKSNIAKSKFR